MEYKKVKTKYTLRDERLESGDSVNYNLFVVRVSSFNLSTSITEEFWSKSVIYQPLRGRLSDTSLRCVLAVFFIMFSIVVCKVRVCFVSLTRLN